MNRCDKLTLKLLDHTISDSELSELLEQARSAERRRAMDALIVLESHLQASGRISIADQVVSKIQQERLGRIEDGVMHAVAPGERADRFDRERTSSKGISRNVFVVGSFAAIAACLLVAWFGLNPAGQVQDVVAQLDSRGALVRIFSADGTVRPIQRSGKLIQLCANETVETSQAIDTAEILYADGTKVELLGQTSVVLSRTSNDSKHLAILSGLVQADVVQQPNGRPMRIDTLSATLVAPGTTLGVEVRDASTQLGVATGLVAMTRKADGQRVEVGAGRYATATGSASEPMESHPFPGLPREWSEDFQDGLPSGWLAGQEVSVQGIRAVKAMRSSRSDEKRFSLTSQNAWQEGQHALCGIDDGSVLHLRIRQDSFARITVMVGARVYPPATGRSGVNLFYTKKAWNEDLAANEWRTIAVPLRDVGWHATQGDQRNGEVGLEGLAAYLIHVSTMGQDAGLMIDRIWITNESERETF